MTETAPVKLQKLSPKHKQVLALAAQGVDRTTIAEACDFTPEYITWLVRQEVCRQYLAEMDAVVDFQLRAMTSQSVNAIQDVLRDGSSEDRLKAARLQLESVGRIGKNSGGRKPAEDPADIRLTQLAERLLGLREKVIEGEITSSKVEDSQEAGSHTSAAGAG